MEATGRNPAGMDGRARRAWIGQEPASTLLLARLEELYYLVLYIYRHRPERRGT